MHTLNDDEVLLDESTMISETDLMGKIVFCNRKFADMNGYDKKELLGRSHNFLRHPDMPKAVFTEMWETIKSGETWKGYIKNLRRDGKHYWAVVIISPTYDDAGKPTGYIAVREAPGPRSLEDIKERYAEMRAAEV